VNPCGVSARHSCIRRAEVARDISHRFDAIRRRRRVGGSSCRKRATNQGGDGGHRPIVAFPGVAQRVAERKGCPAEYDQRLAHIVVRRPVSEADRRTPVRPLSPEHAVPLPRVNAGQFGGSRRFSLAAYQHDANVSSARHASGCRRRLVERVTRVDGRRARTRAKSCSSGRPACESASPSGILTRPVPSGRRLPRRSTFCLAAGGATLAADR
jgi:hypothetical protein